MKWHKISEELPPENKLLLFKCREYSLYRVGFYKLLKRRKLQVVIEMRPFCDKQIYLCDFSHWTEIEPPDEIVELENKE